MAQNQEQNQVEAGVSAQEMRILNLHGAMLAADQTFHHELVRVYGANNASDARYKLRHDDEAVQKAGESFVAASDAWQASEVAARKLVGTHIIGVKNDVANLWLVAPSDARFCGDYPVTTANIDEATRYSPKDAESTVFGLMHIWPNEKFRVEPLARKLAETTIAELTTIKSEASSFHPGFHLPPSGEDRKVSQSELIKKYEINLEKVKAAHPGWKGEDYVAYAELQLEAVKDRGMEGLKDVWQVAQERKPVSEAPDVANGNWMFYWGNGQAGVTHDQAAYPESTEYQVVVRIAESAADGILNEDYDGLADYNAYLRSNGFPAFGNIADFVALQIKLHYQTVVNGDISFAEKSAQAVHLSANIDEVADSVAIVYANTYRGPFLVRTFDGIGLGDKDVEYQNLDAALRAFIKASPENNIPRLRIGDMTVIELDPECGLTPVFFGDNGKTVEAEYLRVVSESQIETGKTVLSFDETQRRQLELPDGVLKMFSCGDKFDCKLGDPVIANGFRGTVSEVCSGQLAGMVEVKLPSGIVCIDCAYPDCYPAAWNGVEVVTEGRYIGAISEVNGQFVAQATGRGKIVAHEVARFAVTPKIGDTLDVQYKGGQAVVAENEGRGVER